MADEGGKTFTSPCDTVSQSAPCFSLPNTKSNSDTEYGSEFQISCLVAIFLIDCTNVLFFTRVFFYLFFLLQFLGTQCIKPVWLLQTPCNTHTHTHTPNIQFWKRTDGEGWHGANSHLKSDARCSISPVQHAGFQKAIRCCIYRNTEQWRASDQKMYAAWGSVHLHLTTQQDT